MADPREQLVLRAIAELPLAYGNTIIDHVCAALGPSRWLRIPAEWRFGVANLYPILMRLEERGAVTSAWSAETFPEHGNRRRRYYRIAEPHA